MQIACVAYSHLEPGVKDKVDALLRANNKYSQWVVGAPDEAAARLYAFVHAATWADDIKRSEAGYQKDAADSAGAGQNIGYTDTKRHDYWHYKDIIFSPDGTPPGALKPVDAVTQLRLMTIALQPSSGASEDVRSYDLVWIIHLVGDLHQPLHAVERFTKEIPTGDMGGNAELVIPATGESLPLHAYWDRIFGGYASPYGAIADANAKDGLATITPDPAAAHISDPQAWAEESFALAQQFAYAPPVGTDTRAVLLTRDYETRARDVARSQAALAAARLAHLLNDALK